LNHRKKTKADGSRLIPRKHTETLVLSSVAFQQISDFKIFQKCFPFSSMLPRATENVVAGHMQPTGLSLDRTDSEY